MTYTEPLLLTCLTVIMAGLIYYDSRRGKLAAWSGVVALLLLSWPLVDWVIALPLVARYPVRLFQLPPETQAIVVLGSSVEPPHYERPYPLPDKLTFDRCEHAAWIYRQWGPLPVLACQGRYPASQRFAMRDLLRQKGVPEDQVWVESESRSTHENAAFGSAILRQHNVNRIVLVVDVQSMARAAACFRKEGLIVTEAPCDIRTLGAWREELLPNWHAIRRNELTLHEVLGLAWYRLKGWI